MRFTLILNTGSGQELDPLLESFAALARELARQGQEVRLYAPGAKPGTREGVVHASSDVFNGLEAAGVLLLVGAPHDYLAATPAQVKWYWSLEAPPEGWESLIVPFCDCVLCPTRAHRAELLKRWPALNSVSVLPLNGSGIDARAPAPEATAPAVSGLANSAEQMIELAEMLQPLQSLPIALTLRIAGASGVARGNPLTDDSRPEVQPLHPGEGMPSVIPAPSIVLCLWPHTINALLEVIEAMRAGSVVAGPLEGWLPEIVGDTGCLLAAKPGEPEFIPRLLAEIRNLVERPEHLRNMADRARTRALSEFSPQSIASRLLAMLEPQSEVDPPVVAVESLLHGPCPGKPGEPFPPSRSSSSICVVIPVRNQARYLARALGSVTWQLGPQDEVIVVDDASEDLGSFSPAAAFRQRIMWLRNDRQRGVSFGRNRAIRRSRAEWIKFLDADDILVPFALEAVRQPDTPLDPGTMVLAGGCHRVLDGRHLDYLEGAEQSLKDILHANPLLPSATFVRRRALFEVGLFDERIDFEEDWDLWLRLHRRFGASAFAVLGVPICYYWIGTEDRAAARRRATVDGVPVREYLRRQYGAEPH